MSVEVKVPLLSESIAEATLLTWRKKEGEHVDRDESLIDIETDKVVLELPAPATGVLAKIIKGDGSTVTSGEVIASIDTKAAAAAGTPGAEPASAPLPVATGGTETAKKPVSEPEPLSQPEPEFAQPAGTPAVPMMPAARSAAATAKLGTTEVSAIKGSGRGGRITKEDITAHVEHKPPPAPSPGPSPSAPVVSDKSVSLPAAPVGC